MLDEFFKGTRCFRQPDMTEPQQGTEEPQAPPEATDPPEVRERDTGTDEVAAAEIAATVEALLFATDSPLTPGKIAQLAGLPGQRAVKQAIIALNEKYGQMGCAFHVEPIAGGYQMLTRPEYHDVVGRLFKAKSDSRLSQAAMETLAIVAYRQPILRADIEAIRGVACGEVLRGLMEKQLVKIVGRAEVLGRPMLYGTTKRFLEVFGLASIEDLPRVEELRAAAGGSAPPESQATDADASEQDAPEEEAPAQSELPPAEEPDEKPTAEAPAPDPDAAQ